LSNGSKSGSDRAGTLAFPLLMECDLRGRVLWMSARARLELGDTGYLPEIPQMCFWRVWEGHSSVLLSVSVQSPYPIVINDLGTLEVKILRHFFRLLKSQRALSGHARDSRRSGGHNAVRQVERERQRLGRELHTGVGQMLAAIRLQLDVIERELPAPPSAVGQALGSISILAAETLEQVRSISKRLHPPEWQRLTLESALRQLWEISGIAQRFQAELVIEPLPKEPELEVKTLIYRAFQEALSNLARHSGASRIEAALRCRGDELWLSVHDDGVGFHVARTLASPANVSAGIGLRSIREATEGLGGRFEIRSGADGTTLEVSVALAPVEQ
jgi:signal transduction histidine kinase